MSEQKVVVKMNGINDRQQVDTVESNLKRLQGIKIHTLGINTVEITYRQNEVDEQQIKQAISDAGGIVAEIKRME